MLYIEAAEEMAMARLDLEAMRARLTAKQWCAVVMVAQGYKQREIAAAMGVKRAAISRLLTRARRILGSM